MNTMERRFFLSLGAATLLSGCGFALRQAPNFAFTSLYVAVAEIIAMIYRLQNRRRKQESKS